MGLHDFLAFPRVSSGRSGVHSEYFLVLAATGMTASTFFPLSAHLTTPQKAYLDKHPWEEEVIQSFLPTILVALLALLIPLLLLLIAKKAHTITTLSALHDRILTRYYKFLIVNVLVFFCVGTAAVQTILTSFRADASAPDILGIVADSFLTAGPFYVGWRKWSWKYEGWAKG